MADDGEEPIDLAAEASPVPQRKLRRLKRSGFPDLEPKTQISKTLDFGHPEEKEITGFRRSSLPGGSDSVCFRRAEVAVSGDILEEVGGFEENGSVSGLLHEGTKGVEAFVNGAFYRGNDREDTPLKVLGKDADARQGVRAEEHNEVSEKDGESSGDDGEEQRAAASENDGEYGPDNKGEEHVEDFTIPPDSNSTCEDEVDGEFQEDRIFTASADSRHLKAKRKRGYQGEGKTEKGGKNNKVGSNDVRASNISASNKRTLEKERRAYLQQLHAESQRLLRETRDASFKPLVGVKKPVSSLLEKMRQRKLELKRRNAELFGISDDITGADKPERDSNFDEENLNAAGIKHEPIEEEKTDPDVHPVKCEADHLVDESFLPSSAGNACGSTAADAVLADGGVNAFRSALDDTQDILCDTQLEEDRRDLSSGISQEEDGFSPSLQNMILNVDSVPQDDESLDEDDDKENVNPFLGKDDMACHAKGDPVKVFVDDEAEDSDDESRHSDEEEELENEDEELKDLIATADEEMPIDREKRDVLHQKWLEERDAAATDDLLQRLKCNWNGKPSEGWEEKSDYEMDGDSISEDDSRGASPTRVVQKNKKLKLDLFKIFPDRDAAYVSSDEEEVEQSYLSDLVLEQSEKQTAYLPPAEDEGSREIFGRIKKLNIAPNNKKRPKTTPSFFDSLASAVNSNSSSRSSFLGRGQSHSLRPANKLGVNMVKSFIFGRDDSNSRTGIHMADNLLTNKEESVLDTVDGQMKMCTSQSKTKTANAGDCNIKKVPDGDAGLSLFDILRRSSFGSEKSLSDSNLNCSDMTFDAFRTVKATPKIEKRVR